MPEEHADPFQLDRIHQRAVSRGRRLRRARYSLKFTVTTLALVVLIGLVVTDTSNSRHLAPIPGESAGGSLVSGVISTQLPSPQQVFGSPSLRLSGSVTTPASVSTRGGNSWFFDSRALTVRRSSGSVTTLSSPVGVSDTLLAGTATSAQGAIVVFARQTPTNAIHLAITSDLGSSWTIATVTLPTKVTSAWISATNRHTVTMEVWDIATPSAPLLLTSGDGGHEWTDLQLRGLPVPAGGEALTATLVYERATFGRTLWVSKDRGLRWNPAVIAPYNPESTVAAVALPALITSSKEVTAEVVHAQKGSPATLEVFVSTNKTMFARVGEIVLTTDTASRSAVPLISVVSPSVWEIAYGDELFGSTNQGKTWESVAATPQQAQILAVHVSGSGRGTLVDSSHTTCALVCKASDLSLYTISGGSSEWGSVTSPSNEHTALTVFSPVSIGNLASDISATPSGMWYVTRSSQGLRLGEVVTSTGNHSLSIPLASKFSKGSSLLPAPLVVGATAWVATQHVLFRVNLDKRIVSPALKVGGAHQIIVSLADTQGKLWLALGSDSDPNATGTVEEVSPDGKAARFKVTTPCPVTYLVASSRAVTAEISACRNDNRRQLDTIDSPKEQSALAVALPQAQSTTVKAEVGGRVWAFTSWSPTSLVGFKLADSSSYVSPLVPRACVGNDASSGPDGLWISGTDGLCIVNINSNTVTYLTGALPQGARVLSLAGSQQTEWVATSAGVIELEAALAAS